MSRAELESVGAGAAAGPRAETQVWLLSALERQQLAFELTERESLPPCPATPGRAGPVEDSRPSPRQSVGLHAARSWFSSQEEGPSRPGTMKQKAAELAPPRFPRRRAEADPQPWQRGTAQTGEGTWHDKRKLQPLERSR